MSLESRIDGIEARIHADNVPLPPFTRPAQRPGNHGRPGLALALPRQQLMPRNDAENRFRDIMRASGIIKINGTDYPTEMKDLRELEELGDGTSGHVVKMLHIPSGAVIAVKQMRRTGNAEENKRIVNDIETALKAHGCPYIVQCLGFIITSADVWICMELMATCFDKLLKRTSRPVPEEILGKVTVAVVKALSFLKDKDTMHRDVKPSNILVDERGIIKLCDFGISGQLNNSKAKTRSAGCVAYLAPERIDPNRSEYDIRADVWSLGITLVELATGKFPYQDCNTDFEVLTCVMQSAPPTLPADQGFSLEFQNFVKRCLIHDVNSRPKYKDLLLLPFLMCYESKPVNVPGWLKGALKLAGLPSHQRDQLLQHQMTTIDNESLGSYPEIEMCSPLKLVTSPPPSRIYSPPSPIPSHIPVRHPFANPAPTSNTTHTNVSPEKQYCNFRVGSFESPPAPATASPLRILNHNQSYEQPVVPEPSKVYRKSPFLPRKNKSPESSTTAPKKESKLSTLGSSLLKNLTTSPFSQRKQSVPPPELPPMLVEKRPLNNNFPSHHQPAPPLYSHHHPQSLQHQSRVEGAVGNSQLPRAIFHNSPILHRRNPSYISYGDCSASPSKGRGSANTSPIVLQRFYHQQNQLRDKIGDERPEYNTMDCPENSNPFLGSPQARQKYQTIRSRNHFEHKNDPHGDTNVTLGGSSNRKDMAPEPIMTTTTTSSYVTTTTHQRLNLRTLAPYDDNVEEKKMQRTIHNEEFTQEASVSDTAPATNGKASYEKNLGDVKRRFASYLKVNLSEERRLVNEEFNCQAARQQNLPQSSFAPTNPFLDAADSYLVSPPQEPAVEKLKLDRRHRSPDPPPRYNRQSPLLLRKKLEMSNWGGSPLLSRRLISGSPPIQAPRRDCESVPGSPQHFRTRIHYTPEPQRRFYRP